MVQIVLASFVLWKSALSSALTVKEMMVHLIEERTWMDLFIGGGGDVGFAETLLRINCTVRDLLDTLPKGGV